MQKSSFPETSFLQILLLRTACSQSSWHLASSLLPHAHIRMCIMHIHITKNMHTQFRRPLGASTLAFQLHFIHTIIETKSTSVPTVVFESTLDCNVSTYCYYACDDLASNEGRSVSQKCLVAVTCSEN